MELSRKGHQPVKNVYFCIVMEIKTDKVKNNSKGAFIFKKMLEDKKVIHEHVLNGGKVSDLKDKYKFASAISFIRNR